MTEVPPDWTAGQPRLVVHRCRSCGHAWYLPRQACPACGRTGVGRVISAGAGVVVASTTVWRRADRSGTDAGPVGIVLVDLDEGGRAMGRCPPGTAVGARVLAAFISERGKDGRDRLLPMFEPEGE
jgi:uncharacterized OB-fold protein